MPTIEELTRGKLARSVIQSETAADLCAAGFVLVLIGCAKQGETMQDSIDVFRYTADLFEQTLRNDWDKFRNAPIEGKGIT